MRSQLRVQVDGSGDPVLLLLHGLGATGDVWARFHHVLRERWPGRWVTPDLPGHGGSPPLSSYTFHVVAESVATVIPPTSRLVVLGHSLGGAVGLALADPRFHLPVDSVIGLGIKAMWSDQERERARALAKRPSPRYGTRVEAAQRYLKVSGLRGLVSPDDGLVSAGLMEVQNEWTLRHDPRTFAIGAPDVERLIAATRARVVLAAGEHDPMSKAEQLRAFVPAPAILPGLGHNAHVEAPAALWSLLSADGAVR